jgi:hypothetical protein
MARQGRLRSSWSTTTSPACCRSIRPGKLLDIPDYRDQDEGRRSTPGRYFQVAEPGTGWGGTNISDPLSVLGRSTRRRRGRA